MSRPVLLLATIIALTTSACAQTAPSDSETLRSLLAEVRQLRHDLQTTAVASQRVQIALYRLQLQDAAVARVARIVDEAQTRLNDLSGARRRMVAELERLEEARTQSQDAHERKAIEEETLPELKRRLEQVGKDEEQWQARKSDADGQLRIEQGKLNELHTLLDQLDRALLSVGRTTAQ